jgi:HEPN domain-containing protein
LEQYKDQIKELEEHGIPTTPPEVRAQREKDTTESAENIAETIHKMTELLEKSGQLWT